jgi:hypothetical protein
VPLPQQVIEQNGLFARSKIQKSVQMAVRMVSLKSSKTGEWIARKGIPADARAEYKRLYGVGHEAIL